MIYSYQCHVLNPCGIWMVHYYIIMSIPSYIFILYTQWQMEQVDKFCTKYNLNSQRYVLPSGSQRNVLDRHLIFSRENHFLFCFLPKVC